MIMIPATAGSFPDSTCQGNPDGRLFPLASRVLLRPEATTSEPLRWYAVYTRSRHEKRIKDQLDGMSFESFLPLYEAVHRWKDRRVRVSLPVFPGYVFVRIALPELRRPVVTVPGVVNLVGRPGRPTPIEDQEIEALRVCFLRGHSLVPHPYLTVGRRVRVRSGPLADVEGILLRKKGKSRLILSVQLIARSVAIEVDAGDVAAIGS
jgi:transcription antitermination factor NusG